LSRARRRRAAGDGYGEDVFSEETALLLAATPVVVVWRELAVLELELGLELELKVWSQFWRLERGRDSVGGRGSGA
jgi:hypothetical protein